MKYVFVAAYIWYGWLWDTTEHEMIIFDTYAQCAEHMTHVEEMVRTGADGWPDTYAMSCTLDEEAE